MSNNPDLFTVGDSKLMKFPQRLSVYLTRLCNMKCPHCLLRLYDQDFFKKDEMDLSHAKTILTHFYNKGIRQLTVASFGEVLLYPHFRELARFAREMGFKPVSTVSNGLIVDQYFDCLLENFQFINISLDGYDNRTYSKHRGGDGLFDKVVKNIEELVRKRENTSSPLHISLVHVIYEENLYDIEKMIALAEKLNVDRIVFKNFHPVQGDYQACTPLYAESSKALDHLSSIMSSTNYKIQIILPSLLGKSRKFYCSNLFNDITIGSDGFFAPCCQIPTEKRYESFFDEPEAFFKNEILTFKKRFLKAKTHADLAPICRQCQALNLENDIFFQNLKQWKKRYLNDNFTFAFQPGPSH